MSTVKGKRLKYTPAAVLAYELCQQLSMYAERAEVVGSVRRRKSEVGDIEILVEPRMTPTGLFGESNPDIEAVQGLASRWGTVIKSGDRYIQVQLSKMQGLWAIGNGVTVDIFLCHPPAQWGSLLAIRTGPAELARHAVMLMTTRGYRHRDGHVETARGEVVPTPTEMDFFRLAGLPCLRPDSRDSQAAYISTDVRSWSGFSLG